jgi:pyruvate dehydrogenase E1 component alpha subunit
MKTLQLYHDMLRIRRLEEVLAQRYSEWNMRCPMHLCIGQEAIAVGVCSVLKADDKVFSNHRAHGHYLAKGGDMNALVAELYGKVSGCARGRGGSMHLIDQDAGFMGATPIVGGTVPLAVGAAWSARLQHQQHIAVVFFGDGCFEEGVLHESMNFAALHKLPVMFVCENNQYSVYTGLDERQPRRPIHGVAAAHGLHVLEGDGNDVLQVQQLASQARQSIEQDGLPQFLELHTHRWLEHCGPNEDDHLQYRPPGELQRWKQRDPLTVFLQQLPDDAAAQIKSIQAAVEDEVAAAFVFAEQSPFPDISQLGQELYAS